MGAHENLHAGELCDFRRIGSQRRRRGTLPSHGSEPLVFVTGVLQRFPNELFRIAHRRIKDAGDFYRRPALEVMQAKNLAIARPQARQEAAYEERLLESIDIERLWEIFELVKPRSLDVPGACPLAPVVPTCIADGRDEPRPRIVDGTAREVREQRFLYERFAVRVGNAELPRRNVEEERPVLEIEDLDVVRDRPGVRRSRR